MESQPQNPEFRINPVNFHPCCQLLTCSVFRTSGNLLTAYITRKNDVSINGNLPSIHKIIEEEFQP